MLLISKLQVRLVAYVKDGYSISEDDELNSKGNQKHDWVFDLKSNVWSNCLIEHAWKEIVNNPIKLNKIRNELSNSSFTKIN